MMQRILIPLDAAQTSLNALGIAIKISKERSIPLCAVFLKEKKESNGLSYLFPNDLSLTEEKGSTEDIADEDAMIVNDEIALFKKGCEAEGITYKIEIDISIEHFIDQALDTDLMVTNKKEAFLVKVLPRLSCPAYLASKGEVPGKVILLYDGSSSSKHAINKYTSFFPEWLNFPTSVVSINVDEKDNNEIELEIINELQPLFSDFTIHSLKGNKEKELISFLEQNDSATLVVMGAFGRSTISRFFHDSLANTVIESSRCSLFIAR